MKLQVKIPQISLIGRSWKLFALVLVGLLFVYWEFVSGRSVFIFKDIGKDTWIQFYPRMLGRSIYWQKWGIELWSFSKGIGQSAYGKGLLNPLSYLELMVPTHLIAESIIWFKILETLIFAGIACLYFRIIGLGKYAISYGVMALIFSGYYITGSTMYGHSVGIIYFLLLLLGFELFIQKKKWWVIVMPCVLMFGPRLLFNFEFLAIYAIWRFYELEYWSKEKFVGLFKVVWKPVMVSLGIIAPFIGSTLYRFLYSPRVGGDLSKSQELVSKPIFGMEEPIHYITAIQRFFSTDILGTAKDFQGWYNYIEAPLFYIGILTLVLFPQYFVERSKKLKIVFAGVLLFWLLIIVFPFLRNAFYFFVGDYYKSAITLFIPFTLLYMAVQALDRILRGQKVNTIVLGVTVFFLLLGLYFPYNIGSGVIKTDIQLLCTALVMSYAFLVILLNYKTTRRPVSILIASLVIIEFFGFAKHSISTRQAVSTLEINSKTGHNDDTNDIVKYLGDIDKGFYRVEKYFGSVLTGYNDAIAQGYFGSKSYSSHNHNNYVNFLTEIGTIPRGDEIKSRWLFGMINDYQLHSLFSFKYFVTNEDTKIYRSRPGYKSLGLIGKYELLENTLALPFGVPFDKIIYHSEFSAMSDNAVKKAILNEAVVIPQKDRNKYPGLNKLEINNARGEYGINDLLDQKRDKCLKLSSWSPNHFKGAISNSSPNILLFTMPHDEGWKAWVDGERADLEYVDMGLTGLYLSEGNHKIELKYRPPFYYVGWGMFWLTVIVLIVVSWRGRKKSVI